jgi:hypothetical protein
MHADVHTLDRNHFDCGDWLLYVVSSATFRYLQDRTQWTQMASPAAGMGRAFCSGLVSAKPISVVLRTAAMLTP